MIAQLFAEFHATFEVFHHSQCIVILGFQFGDALVQGVLVGLALFLQKIHGLCHGFEVVLLRPTLVADALALGHPRLDVDQFPDGILLELNLGFAFGIPSSPDAEKQGRLMPSDLAVLYSILLNQAVFRDLTAPR